MNLPIDILSIINSYLYGKDRKNFLIVNPSLVQYLRNKYCKNKLVKERFDRVSTLKNNQLDVVLDSMYYHHPYHETSMLIIKVIANIPSYYNIEEVNVSIIYSKDQWNTKEEETLKLHGIYDHGDDYDMMWEVDRDKMVGKSSWIGILPTDIWFCIKIEVGGHYNRGGGRGGRGRGGRMTSDRRIDYMVAYDNNGGWNYCDDIQYHHIPSYYDINKYPFMDYWYSDNLCMDVMDLEYWMTET